MIVMITFACLMATIFLGFMTMQGVTRCTRWKRERDAKRGPKTEENADYAEDDGEDEEANKIEHENIYYGEVKKLLNKLNILLYNK